MDSLRQMIKKNQTAVIVLVVIAGLFIVYNTFIKSEDGPDLRTEARGVADLELGRDIIVTLNKLKTINIDTGILEDTRFKKLQDFSEPLPQYSEGKQNPFELEVPGRTVESVEVTQPVNEEVVSEPVVETVDASDIN